MSKRVLKIVLAITLVLTLVLPQTAFAEDTASQKNIEYLKSVMDMIKEKYKGEVTDQQLIEGALKGMFNTMDKYSVFFDPKEAEEFLSDVGGKYYGIGVGVNKSDDYILITKVFAASPAEKAGIIPGDKIVSVDGKSLIGVTIDEAVTWIKGDEGTEVTLGIIKSGQTNVTSVKLQRAEIKVSPVTYDIRNGIGYIKIESFNANTDENVSQALSEMDKNNITKIVLDLRNNPGGELDQAIDVARHFVPEGPITKLDYKSDYYQDKQYNSSLKSTKYKLVLLVNKMSASASEIVAGAVQDTNAGTLVGTKTFGKSVVQTIIPMLTPEAYAKYEKKLGVKLLDAFELINKYQVQPLNSDVIGWSKITVGEYITPKGRVINNVGLDPDVKVDDYAIVKDLDVNNIQKLTKTVKPTLGGEGIDVLNAEKILLMSGYDIDKPDTKLDAKTYNAIMKFQKDNGLSPYGVMDFSTQKALNDKLDKLIIDIDKQYTKAVEILNK
ncbi:MAG: S41 family peptidase [Clostridia bacterium]|nr:S41 family peptidase [Clostridia bacterium]